MINRITIYKRSIHTTVKYYTLQLLINYEDFTACVVIVKKFEQFDQDQLLFVLNFWQLLCQPSSEPGLDLHIPDDWITKSWLLKMSAARAAKTFTTDNIWPWLNVLEVFNAWIVTLSPPLRNILKNIYRWSLISVSGSVLNLMSKDRVHKVLAVLLQFLNNPEWEARHGG